MSTKRPTVEALEKILGEKFNILDHGFIRVVDYMGDDSSVVQAARVSYGAGTKTVSEDKALINYLIKHNHTSPFEMCEIKFHVKLPIFVARQWIRHRTANVNEYSARYSILSKEFYLPQPSHICEQSVSNKQGRGTPLSPEQAEKVIDTITEISNSSYQAYETLLNEPYSLARELARTCLPLNFYTEWYWKIDLHNLLHFVSLRADTHAQYEIRVYAEKIYDILSLWVPYTCAAFEEHKLGGVKLSKTQLATVRKLVAGEKVKREESGLSKRDWDELQSSLG